MVGIDYALSFDFNDDIFAFIVSKIPSNMHDKFSKILIGKSFPFSVNLPLLVETFKLECRLGSTQHGTHDSFVPLIIVGIS